MTRAGVLGPLLFLSLASGQEVAPQSPQPCLHKTLAVNVINLKSSQTVPNLTAESFRAQLAGKPLRISSAVLDRSPRRVLVMLDTSGSMLESPAKWEAARKLALATADSAPPPNSLALITFARGVEQMISFSEGREAVLRALGGLPAKEKQFGKGFRRTALFDALKEGLGLFSPPAFGDTIILITDGEDNASRTSEKQVLHALARRGVRIIALVLPDQAQLGYVDNPIYGSLLLPNAATPPGVIPIPFHGPPGEDPSRLLGVVEQSGGRAFLVDVGRVQASPSEVLPDVTRGLARLTDEVYRLEIEVAEPVSKPKGWNLQIVDEKGDKLKDATIVFPTKIMTCSDE